jgi:undecaprenyl diphosphate synthase
MSDEISLPAGTVIPNHIAMILDGNRRWARARGLEPWKGHFYGYKAVNALAHATRRLGIHTFTVWAFSAENWERPKEEIDEIMNVFRRALKETEKDFHKEHVAMIHLGRKDRLPADIRTEIGRIEAETVKYAPEHIFNMAVDYGGRDEIVRAVRKIVKDKVPAEAIDEKKFEKYLDTYNQPYPDPDLFIRTSGEQRTSGFLPWQMTYTEFYFEPEHLPDFSPDKLKVALLDYSRRRRRFGGNDAVEHFGFDPQVLARLELKWWRLGKIPEGTKFREYALAHIKEQYGLSKHLAGEAAHLLFEAITEENKNKLEEAKDKLKKFYVLIKDEVKLAFEPEIVASLEVRMRNEKGESEDTTREYLAEVYRISLFQAAKAAHLKVLANVERNLAQAAHSTGSGSSSEHWAKAEDYLQKYYRALKERVA